MFIFAFDAYITILVEATELVDYFQSATHKHQLHSTCQPDQQPAECENQKPLFEMQVSQFY